MLSCLDIISYFDLSVLLYVFLLMNKLMYSVVLFRSNIRWNIWSFIYEML